MDKPISMSVKEYICRLMSIKMNVPLKTIEMVVDHQFQSANEALRTNYSIEISGFGKFLFNHKKAQKKWETNISKKAFFESLLLDPDITEQKRISTQNKLDSTIAWLGQMKPKIDSDEHKAILGGLEKQVISTKESEVKEINRTNLPGKNGDM